jgi:hypothetical protein
LIRQSIRQNHGGRDATDVSGQIEQIAEAHQFPLPVPFEERSKGDIGPSGGRRPEV